MPVRSVKVKGGQVYRHFKGGIYLVKSVDVDSEDPTILRVSYMNAKKESFSRPYDMFIEDVRIAPASWIPRFCPIDYTEWENDKMALELLKQKEERVDAVLASIKPKLLEASDIRMDIRMDSNHYLWWSIGGKENGSTTEA